MKSNIKYIIIFLLACLSFSGFTQEIHFSEKEKQWIAEHPVIEFGYDLRWEPYEIYTSEQYGGIVSDYVEIIGKKTGIDFKPLPDMNWSKSIKGLADGSIMVVPSMVDTPIRDTQFVLSNPYLQDPIVIVALKGAPYFSKLEDLKGKTVSLSKNYYTVELIKKNYPEINIKEFETIEKCFKAITNGETDAFVGKLNVITYYINHYGFDNVRIVGTTPFEDNGICFAITPKHKILKGIIDKIIVQITPEQKHQIREKWIAGEGRKIYSTTYIIWAIAILLVVFISLTIFYFWNRMLNKQLKKQKEIELQLKSLLIEVKKSDDEKKILLQEIHHRVKNNLQIVSSMLNLQANTTSDEKTRQSLKEAMDRVSSISLVHKKMYQYPENETVDLKNYIESLFNDVCIQYPNCSEVKLMVKATGINSTMDSIIPLALIINELITNSLKYAFHSQNNPLITIDFSMDNNKNTLDLNYSDNGSWIENEQSDEFGTSMIDIFTEQIDGNYRVIKTKDSTTYLFTFEELNRK